MPVFDKFKELIIYGAAFVTIMGLGVVLGEKVTTGKKELLEARIKVLETEAQKHDAEAKELLAEVTRCQTSEMVRPTGGEIGENSAKGLKIAVAAGDTGEVGGRLIIAVVGIRASFNPLSYEVTANFGAPGKATLPAKLHVGEQVSYNGYEIRVLAAGLATAKFGIWEVGATGT